MQHRDQIILQKMISEIDVGLQLMGDTKLADFLNNEMMKRALAMTVVNVGELVKSTTEEIRLKYKEIPWKAIAGMRDITAHKYQTLRMEDVYYTVTGEFIELKKQLNKILQNEK